MTPPFVKKFDFRGVYQKDITDQDGYYLGLAVQKVLPMKRILIGWDTRKASKQLAFNFIQAFQGTEVEINYIDICPIDFVTAGANAFEFDFSVMFTGSHNPWDWTGLLMHTKDGASVEGELVTQIVAAYEEVKKKPYVAPNVNLADHINFQPMVESTYVDKIHQLMTLEEIKPLKVAVDIGDGSGSKALAILERILPEVTFTRINDRNLYDVKTPHVADPSNLENMQQLIEVVKEGGFDCGFAFDSDADRVLGIDEKGNYINGSLIGSAMIDNNDSLNMSFHNFGYAVECGSSMHNTALNYDQVETLPVPVGRSIMRRLIREETVDLAVENVGHFYNKFFFQTDSGAFSLLQVLYWISKHGPLSTLTQKHPDGQRTQFTKPKEADDDHAIETLASAITDQFKELSLKKIMVDGIRYEFYDHDQLVSWFAIRDSGYEPIKKYYFGSLEENAFKFLSAKILK